MLGADGVAEIKSTKGWIIVTEVFAVQPFASVTTKKYAPAVLVKFPVPV